MRCTVAAVAGGLVLAVMLGPGPTLVSAGDEPAPTALDLSIRARALGLVPDPYSAGNLGLETVKAPTGAGTTRMPQAASGRDRGVYLGVVVCEPDGTERVYYVRVDDSGSLPEGPIRTGAPGPRGLFLPGRPTP